MTYPAASTNSCMRAGMRVTSAESIAAAAGSIILPAWRSPAAIAARTLARIIEVFMTLLRTDLGARRRVRREISQHELHGGEKELVHFRVEEHLRCVAEAGVEDAPLTIALDPGDGIVVVLALEGHTPLMEVGRL